MPPTDQPVEERDWLALVERLLGLGMTVYLVWMLCPSLQQAVKGKVAELRAEWNRRQVRKQEIIDMTWEAYLVASYSGGDDLERYLDL